MNEYLSELTELRRITKRLDVLISIMLITAEPSDKLTTSRKIEILNDAGLRAIEIAELLSISPKHVSVELSRKRNKITRKKK